MKRRMIELLAMVLLLAVLCASGASAELEPLAVDDAFLESLKGLEVTIVYPWAIDEDTIDTEDYDYQHLKALEEKYGFKVTYKGQGTGYETAMVTAVMSGYPLGNVMLCSERDFVDWQYAGIMADLTDAAEMLGIDFQNDSIYNRTIIQHTNVDGGQYAFNYGYENAAYVSLYYNKRILEENNLTDPHELLQNGEWTWAKLKEYAQICQVIDTDGAIIQYGLGSWTIDEGLTAMIYANDGSYCAIDEEGRLKVNLQDPRTVEAMQTYYDWCNVDKIMYAPEGGWKTSMQDFVNGGYAFLIGTDEIVTIANNVGMEDEYGIITFPVGPSNTSGDADYQTNLRYWFIPITYQEEAAKYLFVMDLIRRADPRTFEEKFDKNFFLRISDEASFDHYRERMRSFTKYALYGYSGIAYEDPGFFGLAAEMYYGQSTPGTLIDKYANALQTTLDDIWGDVVITGVQ